jgi:hypothetical protein
MRDFKRVETLWVNMIELGSQDVEDEKESAILSAILIQYDPVLFRIITYTYIGLIV